jgi:O-antigen ligase
MWPIDYRMIDLATSGATTYLMGGWIRPFSTMPGPFHLGAYIMILLLLILALLTSMRLRPSIRLLLVGLFISQIALLLMTRTKGNWGGFLVGAIVLFVLQSRNPIRAIVRLGGFALLGGIVIFLLLSFASGNTLTVLDDAIFAITHPTQAPTFIYRMSLWQESIIPAIVDKPFMGYGTSSAGEGLFNLYVGTGSLYLNSHNLYIKVLLELGIVGLILFIWIVGESVWKGLRQLRRPNSSNPDSTLLLQWSMAVVTAFLVSGLVIPTLDAYPVNYYFWLLLGLLSRTNTLSVQT